MKVINKQRFYNNHPKCLCQHLHQYHPPVQVEKTQAALKAEKDAAQYERDKQKLHNDCDIGKDRTIEDYFPKEAIAKISPINIILEKLK